MTIRNGVSFGRYAISTGEEHFVLQTSRTPGGANAGPLVGPLVISEINHHAAAVGIDLLPYQNTMLRTMTMASETPASLVGCSHQDNRPSAGSWKSVFGVSE